MVSKSLAVIILAAGKGTRMRSDSPKVLHKLCGLSLLERSLRVAVSLQPAQVIVVKGYGAEQVDAELARLAAQERFSQTRLTAVLQKEQLGTGHAAMVGLEQLDAGIEEVLILPGDAPLLRAETVASLREDFVSGLVFLSCLMDRPQGFGRVLRDAQNKVFGVVEERDCSPEQREVREINGAMYLLEAAFLRRALPQLKNDNSQKEFYLTDIVAIAAAEGLSLEARCIDDAAEVAGANSRAELSELERIRRQQRALALMDSGVSLEDPTRLYIDEDVEVGRDCFIGANSRLQGHTKISEGVIIEGDCLIRDSNIGAGCLIRLGCYLVEAELAGDCRIGPFAHLRPGSKLGDGVHIGNFVETKMADLAAGVKANHLTYLGDVSVGASSNIGAGTITCNYDGVKKSRTSIGETCFIGSNSALVAPVNIGNGSYVAAGSTITGDVPADSLAVARGRQKNIVGWKERKRSSSKKA